MRRPLVILLAIAVVAVLAVAAAAFATAPETVEAAELDGHEPDVKNGEYMFWATGCASCHAPAEAKEPEQKRVLSGGRELVTDFGTFRVPNISPSETAGIGGWSAADFVSAVKFGTSPGGEHLYPSFPYASYHRMRVEDVLDIKAFIDTLPPSDNQVADHDLAFPYNLRWGLGLWKLRYLRDDPVLENLPDDPSVRRGAYLVEAASHCGECHTPRDAAGGLRYGSWLSGAPNPDGDGVVPNITPHPDGIGDWSDADLVYALTTGLTPSYDSLGGSMADVVRNLSQLEKADIEAIVAYLRAVPPRAKEGTAAKE